MPRPWFCITEKFAEKYMASPELSVCILGASASDESPGLWVYLLNIVNPGLGISFSITGQVNQGSLEIKIC
mgnify:CR=1 FL=1